MHDITTPEQREFAELLQQFRHAELRGYLENLRQPVWECELMRIALPEANLLTGTPIEMYRWHFMLFHVLYSLAPEFTKHGQYLHIHFMRTCVADYPEPSFCRHFAAEATSFCNAPCSEEKQFCDFHFQRIDETAIASLSERYFYLDRKNFTALSAETAEKFIGGAWHLLQNYEDYLHSLAVMGLPEGVTRDVIKKRFRYLAKSMHPDINTGHHQEFARINSAYHKLLKYLG